MSQVVDWRLHLGTATHVWVQMTQFRARALGELHRKVSKMDWKDWIVVPSPPPNDDGVDRHSSTGTTLPVSVVATCEKSRLIHSKAVGERVHRGICDSLRYPIPSPDEEKSLGRHPPTDDGGDPIVKIIVKVYRDEVTILLETSLTPLHRRGYRTETGKAPLREDIAYAMLYASGWKPTVMAQSNNRNNNNNNDDASDNDVKKNNPYNAFLDPFCGSGTIAIEAAAMKLGLAPGRLRSPPLQGTPFWNANVWNRALKMASDKHRESVNRSDVTIFASDRDEGAIRITRANAARAGVDSAIVTESTAFSGTPWFHDTSKIPGTLLIASNLPFGHRLVWSKGPEHFYQKLLHHIRRVFQNRPTTLSAAILLTSEPTTIRRCGGKPKLTTRLQTLHGGVPVTGLFASSPSPPSSRHIKK